MYRVAVACARRQETCTKRKETEMETDPICKMQVDPKTAAGQSEYEGKTYYFCAPGCKQKFDANPSQYAKK